MDKDNRYLEIIIGPMFSGKSTEIIKRIKLLQTINKKVLVVKPVIDNRYELNKITTHNQESVDCIVLNNLNDINFTTIESFDSLVIDEAQFFPDLFQVIEYLLDNFNINIIVAGLDGDFQRKPIGQILTLIPLADKCIKLNSYCSLCKDRTEAPFSFRLDQSKEIFLVGGADKYIPVCRKHYDFPH